MILAQMTWPEVASLSRDTIVLIPTGSLEQHGPHLPLFTDSLLATFAATSVEQKIPSLVLLTPTLWLGASGHHLKFQGTLSASFETYMGAIRDVVESLRPHGFHRFFVINGHGGNSEPNGVALRTLKAQYPECTFGHSGYWEYASDVTADVMEGPAKGIQHACEGEVSLMLHCHPELVRTDKLRDDGLYSEPAVRGVIYHFDEMTEQGSLGYATLATAEKGKAIMETCVTRIAEELTQVHAGVMLVERPR